MKIQPKRLLSFAMALLMCLSLLVEIRLPAQASTYVYNWGSRGTTATYLTEAATDFYQKNTTSYAELSALSGSATTSAVPSSELYAALHELMYGKLSDPTTYAETKDLFKYTDCENGGGKISSFYTGLAIGPDWDGAWNREHTWPNSKSAGGSDSETRRECDIMMLRPTTQSENSGRGNTAYGESSSFYDPNSESEGAYDLRGDVARILLYVYTCWGGNSTYADGALNYMWGSNGVIESREVLLDWMEADPVDTWELGRNDAVESITGTRNVFVDYPELAFLLLGDEIPNYVTPSGEAAKANFAITPVSSNDSHGTVTVTANQILAVPALGYQASGYEVLSGTATVTQNGNTFTVVAESDCTIRILFTETSVVTLTYSEQNQIVSTESCNAGAIITLPDLRSALPEDLFFVGWVTDAVATVTEKPAAIYPAGSEYTLTGDTTLYALYTNGTGSWTKITNAASLTSGIPIIIAAAGSDNALSTTQNSNNRGVAEITRDGDQLAFEEASGVAVLELQTGTAAGTFAFYDASNNGYLYAASSSSNYLRTQATNNANSSFAITIAANGAATVKAQGTYTHNWLRYNSSSKLFACYSSGQADICLYTLPLDFTTYYTTFGACPHAAATEVAATPNSCEGFGYTAGVYCSDCQTYIDGHEQILPHGHSYKESISGSYLYRTCSICLDSQAERYYPVSFSVPYHVTALPQVNGAAGITLPSAEAPEGYTFVGWTTTPVTDVKEAPEYKAAGSTYTATKATTLYALYSQSGGSSESGWILVTDASTLAAGDQIVIAAKGYNYALSTAQNGNNRGSTAITKSGNQITFSESAGVAVLELQTGTKAGTFAFYDENKNGYLYAASSSSNHLKTQTTNNANSSFAITIAANGAATVKAQGSNTRNWLRFNNSNNPKIFSCYGSGQQDICLYRYVADSSATYTTLISEATEATVASGYSLSLNGDIDLNLYYRLSEALRNDPAAYAVIKTPAGETTVLLANAPTFGEDSTLYRFSGKLPAKEMTETVTVTLYNGEGEEQVTNACCPADYAKYVLETDGFSQELKELMRAMVTYGAAAQAQFQHKTEAPADAHAGVELDLSGVTAPESAFAVTGTLPTGITYLGTSLLLKSETAIRHYFRLDAGADDSIEWSGENANGAYLQISNIAAQDLDNVYTCTLGDWTIRYNVLTYANIVLSSDSQTEALKDLARALIYYNEQADAIFNNR